MLIGEEVNLEDILNCREERFIKQRNLQSKYKNTLISFCMNIPGPVKTNDEIKKLFQSGLDEIYKFLQENNILILEEIISHEKTGDEIIIATNSRSSKIIKDAMVNIEENHPLGRLFDIDVLGENLEKLSRPINRKCFLCDEIAQDCASTRRHSVQEMQDYIDEKLKEWLLSLN